mmetsp:Transcript_90480/g.198203  ORF Transcript_90480/g.198203 Transcript_90480/m.198203 type:complete len:152 (+) Transcript_90480:71-526(+)
MAQAEQGNSVASTSRVNPLPALRAALEERSEEKWVDAVTRAEREGYDGDQIANALEEIIAKDPIGCHRFMENMHRPPQAMAVINIGQECDEWEQAMRYSHEMINGALSSAWGVLPRVPREDPWADNVDKAHAEVVGNSGVVMKLNGMTSRY